MKKYLILSVIFFNTYLLRAQIRLSPTQVSQQVQSKPTDGSDKEIYSGYFSGLLNMAGTDGKSGIQLSSTLYTIIHFKKIAHNDSLVFGDLYRKQWLFRNIQLTAGFTPGSKDQFEVDAVSYGLKIALLNNKHFTKDEVAGLNTLLTNTIAPAFDFLEKYQLSHPADAGKYQLFKRGKIKVKDLPQDFQDALTANYNLKKGDSPDDLFDMYGAYKILVKKLKTKPLLTLSANSSYTELKSQANNYILSATYAFYANRDTARQYSITTSHTWAADTATYKGGLVRNITEVSAGLDFQLAKWLEFKPALDYVNTLGPLYKKENKNTGNIAATPRIKINKSFWLPVTFKYNAFQKNAHVQGQFTVQYSLK